MVSPMTTHDLHDRRNSRSANRAFSRSCNASRVYPCLLRCSFDRSFVSVRVHSCFLYSLFARLFVFSRVCVLSRAHFLITRVYVCIIVYILCLVLSIRISLADCLTGHVQLCVSVRAQAEFQLFMFSFWQSVSIQASSCRSEYRVSICEGLHSPRGRHQ